MDSATLEEATGEVVNSTEAGEMIGVTGQTVRNWINEDRLSAEKRKGEWAIPVVEVLRERYWREFSEKVGERTFGAFRGQYEGAAEKVAEAAEDFVRTYRHYCEVQEQGATPAEGPWGMLDQAAVNLRDQLQVLSDYRGAFPFVYEMQKVFSNVEPDRGSQQGDGDAQPEIPLDA